MDDTKIASIVSDFREGIQGSANLYHKLRIAATERDAALAELAELRKQYDDQAQDRALERHRAEAAERKLAERTLDAQNLYAVMESETNARKAAERKLAALVEAAQPIIDAHYDPGILPANVTAGMIADLERAVAMAQEEI
jgi:hypothetical protein